MHTWYLFLYQCQYDIHHIFDINWATVFIMEKLNFFTPCKYTVDPLQEEGKQELAKQFTLTSIPNPLLNTQKNNIIQKTSREWQSWK